MGFKLNIGYVINNFVSVGLVMEIVRNVLKDGVNYFEFNSIDSLLVFYKEYINFFVGIEFEKGKEKGFVYIFCVLGGFFLLKNKFVGECSYIYMYMFECIIFIDYLWD